MSFDEKKLLKRENLNQISKFILSDRETLTVRHHSIWPGTVFCAEITLLHKQKEQLSGTNHLGFIYETKLPPTSTEEDAKPHIKAPIDRRPSADSFYWQTTQKHIQDAIDYGIFDSGALTSKVIGAVGRYRLEVLERAYDNGIISNKFEHKEMLLRLTQARIRNLQDLERLTNAYDMGKSTDGNAHHIIDTIEDYLEKMDILREQVRNDLTILDDYDLDAREKIATQITADMHSAEQYRDNLIQALSNNALNKNHLQNTVLGASGPNSIAHFIKLRMISALREAQEHNQNMTYSRDAFSFSRGQLNSYCEDALRVINEHQCDHHNPTLKEHQGYYGTVEESVTINFEHLGKNRQKIRQHLMAITQIEGKDIIAKDPENKYCLISTDEKRKYQHRLKTTRLTGWDVQDNKTYLIKRIAFWFWNFLFVGMIGGLVIDLVPNLYLGLRGREPKSFVARCRLAFTPVCVESTQFITLADKINIPMVSLGAKVGGAIGNFFRNTIWEIRNGVKATYQLARLQIFDNLTADYHLGHNPLPDQAQIFDLIKKDLDILQVDEQTFLAKLAALQELSGVEKYSKIESHELVSRYAHAPYEQNPGEWSDALNSALNGAKHIIEAVTHEVHAKHAFAGLLFNAFYIAGALAILAPSYVEFMGKIFLQVSEAIAKASSTQPLAGAISSGFYQAYITATVSELFTTGRSSGLLTALTSLEDQPSSFMIYGSLAVGLGWFLANVLNIPGISDGIREELGTVPPIAYGAAGAKFGIVLLELFNVEPGEADPEHTAKREKLQQFFKTEYPEFDKAKVDSLIEDLLNHTLVHSARPDAKEAMHRLEFLMVLQKTQHLLPNLSHLRKRQLIEVMRRQERHDPQLADALTQLLFPEHKRSILGITLNIIFGYVFAIARCFASIVTWNSEPFRFLFTEKIPKDLARVYHALNNKILNTFFNYLRAMIRGIFDVVVNEIFARAEGLIRNKRHSLSRGTYTISSAVDRGFASAKEFFGRIFGMDPLRKAVTKPHASSVLHRIFHKYRYGLTSKSELQHQTEFCSSQSTSTLEINDRSTKTASVEKPSKKPDTTGVVRRTTRRDWGKMQVFLNKAKRAAEIKEHKKNELIKTATINQDKVPEIIRALLKDAAYCQAFFETIFVLGDANNVFYQYLKASDLNYEILLEIMNANLALPDKNAHFNSDQLIQLMCLDRSGNIAIDFLTKQLNPKITVNILKGSHYLINIIKQYYHNPDVLSHLKVDTKNTESLSAFVEVVGTAYKQLFKTDKAAALQMLSALIDNDSTQTAMITCFREKIKLLDLFTKQKECGVGIAHLSAQINHLARFKSSQGWKELARDFNQIFEAAPEKKKQAPEIVTQLFKHEPNGLGFTFFSHSPSTRTSVATPRRKQVSEFKQAITI